MQYFISHIYTKFNISYYFLYIRILYLFPAFSYLSLATLARRIYFNFSNKQNRFYNEDNYNCRVYVLFVCTVCFEYRNLQSAIL